jgi:hypothetical protein
MMVKMNAFIFGRYDINNVFLPARLEEGVCEVIKKVEVSLSNKKVKNRDCKVKGYFYFLAFGF